MTATRQLTLGTITVKEFLLQCSHSAETYLIQEICWHINIEQDENMQANDYQEDENLQNNVHQEDENIQDNDHQNDENLQGNDHQDDDDDNNERDVIVHDQIEPLQHEVNVIENDTDSPLHQIRWNEEDFIITEEMDPDNIYMMELEKNRRILELQNLPYVQVPEILPAVETENQANVCVACLDVKSTHALFPCGHNFLCLMCLESLVSDRCPI
ncbi:RING finger protein B-like isoform X2, partial [Aphis craccivora]